MSLSDLAVAYAEVKPKYELLGEQVTARLRSRLASSSVKNHSVTTRTKDVESFLKKQVRKSYADPMAEITDKVGVRVVVPRLVDVPITEDLVADEFHIIERENKSETLADDQLGYLGVHFLIESDDTFQDSDLTLAGLVCEIQIHTQAQNAWATVSHPYVYKARRTGAAAGVRRRVNRLVALVELFDQEVEAARRELMNDDSAPEVAMLDAIEPLFVRLAGTEFDEELSLTILNVLSETYDTVEIQNFNALIETFAAEKATYFADRVARQRVGSAAVDPLISQPEALVVLERLENARMKLRATWDLHLPPELLTRLSESLGRPLQPA